MTCTRFLESCFALCRQCIGYLFYCRVRSRGSLTILYLKQVNLQELEISLICGDKAEHIICHKFRTHLKKTTYVAKTVF